MLIEYIVTRMDTGQLLRGGETIPIGTMTQQQIFGTRLSVDRSAFQVYTIMRGAKTAQNNEFEYNYQNIVTPIGIRRELQIHQKVIEVGDTLTLGAQLVGITPAIQPIIITAGGTLAQPPLADPFVPATGLTGAVSLRDFFPYGTDTSQNIADAGTIDLTAQATNRIQGGFLASMPTAGIYEACVDLYEDANNDGVYERLIASVGNGYPVKLTSTLGFIAKWWEAFHADPWTGATTRHFLYVVMVKDSNDFVVAQLQQHFTVITSALNNPPTIPVPPSPPAPGITGGAFVQNVGHANSVTLNTTLAIPVVPTVPIGDLMLVRYELDTAQASAPTCADSQGNVYTLDKQGAANTRESGVFSTPVTKQLTNIDTITITFATATTKKSGGADQFSGMNMSSTRVDVSGSQDSAGAITNPSASVATANANDLLYGTTGISGPVAEGYTEDANGWTSLASDGTSGGAASGNRTSRAAYRFVTIASGSFAPPYAYAPVLGTARSVQDLIVAYKQA